MTSFRFSRLRLLIYYRVLCATLFLWIGPVSSITTTTAIADDVSFARDVLPILSDKCFVCHGPDPYDEDLVRLDSWEGATADLGGYHAIDTDDSQASELLLRIHDEDDPMPPEDAEKQLTADEREVLTRWIRQGGRYEKHWAYVPPVKVEIDGKPLSREHAIDHFIAAKHKSKGIAFSEPADRATLARRVALALTGLPPEPNQLARFVADDSDAAYNRLLDELFASSRFGEHQARYWLDAVRYGDTHGLHLDNRRGIYPYRDWVVRALNDNLPLDEFITWQLAGDLLPNPTLDQRVATGFVRMNPSTGEGGAIPDEFQAKNNFDRTETLGTVLLGMSLVCARCHSHKYDPIPQTEYYELMAFFNSTAEPALDGNSYTYGTTVSVPADQAAWERWIVLDEQRSVDLELAAVEFAVRAADNKIVENWKKQTVTTTLADISLVVSKDSPRPELETWATIEEFQSNNKDKKSLTADEAAWFQWEITSGAEQTAFLSFDGPASVSVWLDDTQVDPIDEHYVNGRYELVPLHLNQEKHTLEIRFAGKDASLDLKLDLLNPCTKFAAAVKDKSGFASLDGIDKLLLHDIDKPHANWKDAPKLKSILALKKAEAAFTTSLVAQDLPQPRETRLLKRGEYDQPIGDPLQPDVISVAGLFPENAPRNRLGLAEWLTAPDQPLVARVLVNRFWQQTFGRGLVRTPEDFGLQGQQPTHPELLDWLAVELQESGWDYKKILRLMVTSDTFKQSSRWRSDIDDPENKLWARGSGYRLDAEVIRDTGLWASGLLDPRIGGEAFKPYQPAGMWEALAHPGSNTKDYVQDHGDDLYRRSLYVYWKRTSPHPMMTLFDAPDRESSCVRRSRTSTSLQSLAMFNETQRVEIGRKFAERLLREADSTAARLDLMFTLLASRPASEQESNACRALLNRMHQRYANAEPDAIALLSTGEAPRDESLNVVELAAWTQVCITVLASDVSIMLH